MTIAEALTLLTAELEEGDMPEPLRQPFTLAAIWADLARIAGEVIPPEVAAELDAPALATIRPATVARVPWLPTDAA